MRNGTTSSSERAGSPNGAADVTALVTELQSTIRGEVRFDDGSRALYATDASNYRQLPIGVVLPRDADDVVNTVALCRRHRAPVLARGGGTSLAGQCCNVAVVLDFSKYMNRILEIDPERRFARVEPGVVLDDLRDAAEQFALTFGPDPATHNHCTLGGMIGNNSCGVHSVMAGKTVDNVEELEIVTYDGTRMHVGGTPDEGFERIVRDGGRRGEIYAELKALRDRYAETIRARYPKLVRRVSGYNLPQLLPEAGLHVARALVGSEGTCVIVLSAKLRLVESPPARVLLVLGYPDVYRAADRVPEILAYEPIGLEGIDDVLVNDMEKKGLHTRSVRTLPDGGGWLLVEFGGKTKADAQEAARRLMQALSKSEDPPSMKVFEDPQEAQRVWTVRESGLGATARVPGESDTWEGWEDSAVPRQHVGQYLREFRDLLNRYGYEGALYGHFGDGCVHTRINFDLLTQTGIETFRRFVHEAADLVVKFGGSFSGEHGDGQSRGELLSKMFGEELVQAFREFKAVWDPDGMMNPGKVVDANRLDANLRLGTDYNPWQPATHFRFPDDHGSFARATVRCVGVGECRREHGGVMCPSYMVTREEKHSTRGRARLLFEMLQGDPLGQSWRSDAVKEALDLCLACKGCKSDCPVNVDMATYKAEFFSHYYSGRLRPRVAYSMGLIPVWARLAARVPAIANALTQTAGLRDLAKWMAGIAPQRSLPRFAAQPFRAWFAGRRRPHAGANPVMLWPDTFTNTFAPEIARAAVEVLEASGFQVIVPSRWLCCGRPLYDYGMLNLAKRWLQRILSELRPQIRAGVPVVVLEPSCAAVFRDELINLFPNDEDAKRLSRLVVTFGAFVEQLPKPLRPWRLNSRALVQRHCHHHAVLGFAPEERLLSDLGLAVEILDSGCCGMAGSFGFTKGEHYDVSVKAGERVLFPAIRQADPDALIIADGFSCREQVARGAGRQALHLAQVCRNALRPPSPASQSPAGAAR